MSTHIRLFLYRGSEFEFIVHSYLQFMCSCLVRVFSLFLHKVSLLYTHIINMLIYTYTCSCRNIHIYAGYILTQWITDARNDKDAGRLL